MHSEGGITNSGERVQESDQKEYIIAKAQPTEAIEAKRRVTQNVSNRLGTKEMRSTRKTECAWEKL